MNTIQFIIYGEPTAQGRPRFSTRGGFVKAYDPDKSRSFKSLVKEVAQLHRPEKLIEGPVNMAVKIFRGIPKSWSHKKQAAAVAGTIRPISKPDLSNYTKLLEDAINTVILRDDSQVVSFDGSGKWYAAIPRAEIIITEL